MIFIYSQSFILKNVAYVYKTIVVLNMIAIFAVMNTTLTEVKRRPEKKKKKIQACAGFEPMTLAIPVQFFSGILFTTG